MRLDGVSGGGFALVIGCLFLGWNGAAAAQDAGDPVPACGGAGVYWIGGSAAESDVAQAGQQAALPLHEDALSALAFRVGETDQPIRLEAEANEGLGDPVLELLDAQGSPLADNDDFGNTLSSRIEMELPPGDYCVLLHSLSGPDEATATLQIATADQPPLFEAEETEAPAPDLAACLPDTPAQPFAPAPLNAAALEDGPMRLTVTLPPSPAYLRFAVEGSLPLTLRANSNALDSMLTLFDADGAEMMSNDDADGSLNARLDIPPGLPAGEYCLAVSAYGAGGGQVEVSAETFDEAAMLRGAYDRGEMVPPAGGPVEVVQMDLNTGRETVALVGGAARWFGFSVDRRTAVMISAYGTGGSDPHLALFAADGRSLEQADDSNDTLDPQLGPVVLEPGGYRLAVMMHGAADAGLLSMRPVRLVFERFFPEE